MLISGFQLFQSLIILQYNLFKTFLIRIVYFLTILKFAIYDLSKSPWEMGFKVGLEVIFINKIPHNIWNQLSHHENYTSWQVC
jgi:hypothetical protein